MPSTGPPPTIIINSSRPAPPTGSQPPPQQQQGPKSSQAVPTAATISKSCYLCDEQNPGDFSPTTKFLDTCLLCSRDFCPIHKSSHWDQVCNINHSTYYHECLENAREKLAADGQASADKRELAEMLIDEGIFPSLGEREKAIFATGPVSECTS